MFVYFETLYEVDHFIIPKQSRVTTKDDLKFDSVSLHNLIEGRKVVKSKEFASSKVEPRRVDCQE